MKIIQYFYADQEEAEVQLAVWSPVKNGWININEKLGELLSSVDLDANEEIKGVNFDTTALFALDRAGLNEIAEYADRSKQEPVDLSAVSWLPAIISPNKILCVGLNYRDHAEEFNDPIPGEPVIFNKASSTLNAHNCPIMIPRASDQIDYEAELVVVIGSGGRFIPESETLAAVAGYTCGNDVSCRDWQKNKPGGQWFLGKSFDTFAPIGPALVLRDEIDDPNNLKIESRLNGKIMQSSNTKNFIFPVEKLISYISEVMTLEPGDLIFTGTPGGVGDKRNPPVYLKKGDRIEVEIEKIGLLSNEVLDEKDFY
ncbi:MAG: fumarylacetoacetate hydrolase family protein [Planctomycetia bacterium]|nr:fumarylacetoacetate hydrolase family protein [Planctomycetia bacterium]